MSGFLIRYTYPGATGGSRAGEMRPVGDVYVLKAAWGNDVFSYTKDPDEATVWPTREAAEGASWRWEREGAVVVARSSATPIVD